MLDDKLEMIETFEAMEAGDEVVLSEYSFGETVTMKKSYFNKLIKEINEARIKNGDPNCGVQIITVSSDEEGN